MGCSSSSIRQLRTNENGNGNATTQVAFDTSPHAIPPSSIKRQSQFSISTGGLGDIWKCLWTNNPARPLEVAVKIIRITDSRDERAIQQAKNRLRREVAVWVTLKHPCVLPLHGTVSGFGQLPALVSTWMHNGALHGYLQRIEPTMERKLQLLKQVVDGLRYLHQNDVIHGDLTSTNVLIDSNGNAVLADFGLSVALAEADRSYYVSYSMGALRWLAPEPASINQDEDIGIAGVPKPTSQSDIFSFGCIILEVFSGKPPFWWNDTLLQVSRSRYTGLEPYRLQSGVSINQRHLTFMRRCWSVELQVRPTIGHAASFIEDELKRA